MLGKGWQIYKDTRKKHDLVFNVYVMRPIAAQLVAILAPTGVTPNQVTLINLFMFLVAGGLLVALPTATGGMIAGMGGACLTLFYPGSWNEGISSGQGLIAVALVIFARWSPLRCVGAALLFGGAGAIGPALQSIGIGWGYHLFNALPYLLTLAILIVTCRPGTAAAGSPGELLSNR